MSFHSESTLVRSQARSSIGLSSALERMMIDWPSGAWSCSRACSRRWRSLSSARRETCIRDLSFSRGMNSRLLLESLIRVLRSGPFCERESLVICTRIGMPELRRSATGPLPGIRHSASMSLNWRKPFLPSPMLMKQALSEVSISSTVPIKMLPLRSSCPAKTDR